MDIVDFIKNGTQIPNPNYKKGSSQPKTLTSHVFPTNDSIVERMNDTGLINSYSLGNVDPDKYSKYGVTINPINTEEEWNKERARNQGAMEQLGHSLVQAGLGQMFYGTFEGFGAVVDGARYLATGEFNENDWTKYWREKVDEVKEDYAIYAENPDEHLRFGDWAWYMENLVNVATTVSLMLPAAGWARAIGFAGKLAGLARVGGWATRAVSKGLALAAKGTKAAKAVDGVSKFGALRSIVSNAGRTEAAINSTARIGLESFLSRTGENFMEAQQVNQEVKDQSYENIVGMINYDKEHGTNKFAELVSRDKDFVNEDGSAKSPEEIASIIANKSSKQTFYKDYWMLGMDFLQLRALGGLWGRNLGKGRGITGSERVALKNKKIEFANEKLKLNGTKEEDLLKPLKDNWINRRKENLKYLYKHPATGAFSSIEALELGEGFEEGFQGIQAEKGKEIAAKIFNPNFTERNLASYLSDPEIWEQALWGAIGGVAFGGIYRGVQAGARQVDAYKKKKSMSPEDYERWKQSNIKESIVEMNGITDKINEFTEKMKLINNNKSPYKYIIDPYSGTKIFKNGVAQNEAIDDEQKELLKQQAIDEFVTDVALDSTDNGSIELFKDLLTSKEFDDFLETKGVNDRAKDKVLNKEIADRMDVIQGMYQQELINVTNAGDSVNPYVNRAAARLITRSKLKLEDLSQIGDNISNRIDELNDTGEDYSDFINRKRYDAVNGRLRALNAQEENINDAEKNNKISKSAAKLYRKDINKQRKLLLESVSDTPLGAIDSVKQYIKSNGESFADTFKDIDNFINEYKKTILDDENAVTPPKSIQDEVDKYIKNSMQQSTIKSLIPTSNEDFNDIYNDIADGMDYTYQERIKDNADKISKYLNSATSKEDVEDRINKVIQENTGNKDIDNATAMLKYAYNVDDESNPRQLGSFIRNNMMETAFINARKKYEEKEEIAKAGEEEKSATPLDEEAAIEENADEETNTTNEETNSTNENNADEEQDPFMDFDDTEEPPASDEASNPSTGSLNQSTESEATNTLEEEYSDELLGSETTDEEDELKGADDIVPEVDKDEAERELAFNVAYNKSIDIMNQFFAKYAYNKNFELQKIIESYNNGDTKEFDKLLKEFNSILAANKINIVYNDKEFIRQFNILVDTINDMPDDNFSKLAKLAALGIEEKDETDKEEKNADTELLAERDPAIESYIKFLKEYCDKISSGYINGKQVININDLFYNLIKDKNISYNVAANLFNRFYEFSQEIADNYYIIGWDAFKTYDAFSFFSALEEKADIKSIQDTMHFQPNDEIDYEKVVEELENVLNGKKKAFIKRNFNKAGLLTNLDVVVTNGKGKYTKIGMLRAVQLSTDNNIITPIRHYSGFRNEISTETHDMDCDFLFNAIINNDEASGGKELLSIVRKFQYEKLAFDINSNEKPPKLSLEDAKTMMDNPLIRKLLGERHYNFYGANLHLRTDGDATHDAEGNDLHYKESIDEYNDLEIQSAATELVDAIGAVLFYGKNSSNHQFVTSFSGSAMGMLINYSKWKGTIVENYRQTLDLQKALDKSDTIETSLSCSEIVLMNVGEELVNIGDREFSDGIELDKTSPNYTPIVMVIDGQIVKEDGKSVGEENGHKVNPINGIQDYSIGVVSTSQTGRAYVAYFNRAASLTNNNSSKEAAKLMDALRGEMLSTLNKYHNKDITFEQARKTFMNIIGTTRNRGLFMFDHDTYVSSKNGYFSVVCNGINLFTVWKPFEDKYHNIHNTVSVKLENGGVNEKGKTTSNVNNFIDESGNINKQISNALDYFFGKHTYKGEKENRGNIYINRSKDIFGHKERLGIVSEENDKFVVNLNGEKFVYDNFLDFVVQTRAFRTKTTVGKGKTLYHKERLINTIYINNRIKDTSEKNIDSTAVSDLLFDKDRKAKPDKKRIRTRDILVKAGVKPSIIDLLENSGIIAKVVSVDDYNEKDTMRDMYFKKSEESGKSLIHITWKGAISMNPSKNGNNKTNAVRLILHENIHRQLYKYRKQYGDAKVNEILSSLEEVLDYTIDSVKDNNAKYAKDIYGFLTRLKNKNLSRIDKLEEFLCESLTQPLLVRYMYNTEYSSGAIVSDIKTKKKSIFQKIIDLVLKLFGHKTINDLRDNTILAKEFLILSGLDENINPITDKVEETAAQVEKVEAVDDSKSKTKTVVHTGRRGKNVTYNVGDIIIDKKKNIKYKVTAVDKDGKIISTEVIEGRDLFAAKTDDNIKPPVKGQPHSQLANASNAVSNKAKSATPVNVDNLNKAKQDLDTLRDDFSKRIKRSDDFAKDHTYYMDGKKVDTSVTGEIHGDQSNNASLQQYAPASTRLGNTIDETARFYFECDGDFNEAQKRGYKPKNVRKAKNKFMPEQGTDLAMWNQMKYIKQYLDERFGAGKYKVVTEEFPIGGRIKSKDGKIKTIAGTMDMIVYTDKNEFYVFDFKTKRANINPNFDKNTLFEYGQQVNMYVELLKKNYPSMTFHTGGLIKFNVTYPKNENGIYDNNKDGDAQLYVTINGNTEKIQDSDEIDYQAPTLNINDTSNISKNDNTFIPVEDGYKFGEIYAMESKKNEEKETAEENLDDYDETLHDDIDDILDDELNADTELLIEDNVNEDINSENVGTYVRNMDEFVNSFPMQSRANIERLMADDLLEYYCTI